MNGIAQMVAVGIILPLLNACALTAPTLPPVQPGKALLVMGFTTNMVEPYQGGSLYSGFSATLLDGNVIEPPLNKGQYLVIEPGLHHLSGLCFWQLRGTMSSEDDLLEAGALHWRAQAGRLYTVGSEIDDYKIKCGLWLSDDSWE